MSLPSRWLRACVEQVHKRYNEYFTTSRNLGVHDKVVYADSTAGAVTLTLPPVAEVAGISYLVKHWLGGAAVNIVARPDAPAVTIPTVILNNQVIVRSDGERWAVVFPDPIA